MPVGHEGRMRKHRPSEIKRESGEVVAQRHFAAKVTAWRKILGARFDVGDLTDQEIHDLCSDIIRADNNL